MDSTELEGNLSRLDSVVERLQSASQDLNKKSLNERLSDGLVLGADKVSLINSYSTILTGLLSSYLALEGEDIKKHEISQELERVKSYNDKLKAFLRKDQKKSASETEAVNKFVDATVGKSTLSMATPVISKKSKHKSNDSGKILKPKKRVNTHKKFDH